MSPRKAHFARFRRATFQEDDHDINKVKLDWRYPFQEDDHDINILGSGINGIVCLYVD